MLLLSAHDRHALLWSSLPLPQSSSVYQLDKPQIFSIHSIPMSFGVWTIFIFHLTHPCSIFVTLCHPTHSYLLSPHLIFHNSESAYSFHFYLPLHLLLGYGLCARPALNMYVYKASGVCCWYSPDLISTWIFLPPVSSIATLGLFLLITQSHS